MNDDDKPNVVEGNFSKDDLRASVETLKRQKQEMMEMGLVLAEIRKAHYDAYIDQGFSEAQALELCKHLTM